MQFPEIPSNSRRMLTPLLSGYPWTTGTLQREDIQSIVDSEHEMAVRTPINAPASTNSWLYRFWQPFLEHLHQFERALLFEQDNANLTNMRRLLQVELAGETSGTVTLRPNTGRAIQSGNLSWNLQILEGPEVLAFGSDASIQIRFQSRFHVSLLLTLQKWSNLNLAVIACKRRIVL